MDHAGVDRAVIQHDRLYGRLDDYLSDCVSRYPDRLVVLAQVDEWTGGRPEQVERVRYIAGRCPVTKTLEAKPTILHEVEIVG